MLQLGLRRPALRDHASSTNRNILLVLATHTIDSIFRDTDTATNTREVKKAKISPRENLSHAQKHPLNYSHKTTIHQQGFEALVWPLRRTHQCLLEVS